MQQALDHVVDFGYAGGAAIGQDWIPWGRTDGWELGGQASLCQLLLLALHYWRGLLMPTIVTIPVTKSHPSLNCHSLQGVLFRESR